MRSEIKTLAREILPSVYDIFPSEEQELTESQRIHYIKTRVNHLLTRGRWVRTRDVVSFQRSKHKRRLTKHLQYGVRFFCHPALEALITKYWYERQSGLARHFPADYDWTIPTNVIALVAIAVSYHLM
jgi:Domain of unknown function (DUF6532)